VTSGRDAACRSFSYKHHGTRSATKTKRALYEIIRSDENEYDHCTDERRS
jgi:hypothetical protein